MILPQEFTYVDRLQRESRKPRRVAPAVETPRERMQRWRRRLSTVGAALLTVAMSYGVLYGHNGFEAYRHKSQESRELARQLQVLQQENQRLEVHVPRRAALRARRRGDLHAAGAA